MQTTDTWTSPVDGDWADKANWSAGATPGAGEKTEISADGTYTVTSSANVMVGGVDLLSGVTLAIDSGTFTTRPWAINVRTGAAITIAAGATLAPTAVVTFNQIMNVDGTVNLNGGRLDVSSIASVDAADVTGAGTVTLSGTGSEIVIGTFLNWAPTIQGEGTILLVNGRSGGLAKGGLVLGALDANQAGQSLVVEGTVLGNGVNSQTGTLEATNGGRLEFEAAPGVAPMPVSGDVQAIGALSTVQLDNIETSGSVSGSDGGVVQVLNGGALFTGGGNNWSNPSTIAGPLQVLGGANLRLLGAIDNTGTISVGSKTNAAELEAISENDIPGGTDNPATYTLVLTGNGKIALADNADSLLTAGHAADILDNEGNTIVGAGQIGGGQTMGLKNKGVIEATGTNALAVNVGTGTVTNEAGGLMEAWGAGGLELAGGLFSNAGTISAVHASTVTLDAGVTLTNTGVVEAAGGHVRLSGAVQGVGTLELSGGSTLEIAGAVAATQTVAFGSGIHATLKLDAPSSFASTINNWALGDTIDLAGTDAISAQITGDTLTIGLQGGGTLDYTLSNPPSGVRIGLSSDKAGGTGLNLYKATTAAASRAVMTQAMAGLAAGGTPVVNMTSAVVAATPLIAASQHA